jgi:hypothetical protein
MSGDGLHVAIVRQAPRELGARFDGYSAKLHEPLESPAEIDPYLPFTSRSIPEKQL